MRTAGKAPELALQRIGHAIRPARPFNHFIKGTDMENHTHIDGTPADKTAETATVNDQNTVTLDEPIQRVQTIIKEITLRKPVFGELRGISLHALAELDVIALQKVLPRITAPALTEPEIARMAPSDLMQLGVKVAVFLLPKADRAVVSPGE